jgi:lysophospholipase L1-like esterase
MKLPLFAAIAFASLASLVRAEEPALKLKDNDVWVMAGDSITAQRLHTNYIEAFFRTRNPKLNLHFRNSGIGGNRTNHIIDRFDYDVAAWKPTIVSIELGMNDVNSGADGVDIYTKGIKTLIGKIRAIGAQPILISSSPVDDGSKMGAWKSPRCEKLHPFTEALQRVAAEENVLFVDQYHPLIDVWGENRRKGAEEAAKNPPPIPAPAPAPPPQAADPAKPVKPAAPKIPPSLVPLGGDAVHPGPVGQTMMAATILKGLKADGDVSSATLAADGKVIASKDCKISDVSAQDGKLSFTRLDETNPWPIHPPGKAALKLMPEALDLSRYMLTVTGLPEGDYKVSVDGKVSATVSAKELAAGWNMTMALETRSNMIAKLLYDLQGKLNNDWRKASKEKNAENLVTAQAAIEANEKELQALIQPVALKIEIGK